MTSVYSPGEPELRRALHRIAQTHMQPFRTALDHSLAFCSKLAKV